MKKRISLLLAVVMAFAMVPAIAFGASTNTVSSVPTVAKDINLKGDVVFIQASLKEGTSAVQEFMVTLSGGEWLWPASGTTAPATPTGIYPFTASGTTIDGVTYLSTANTDNAYGLVQVTHISKTQALFQLANGLNAAANVKIPMAVKAKTVGAVTATIDPRNSNITGGTYTIANCAEGATSTTVASSKSFVDNLAVDTIVISELTPGTITPGGQILVKVAGDFNVSAVGTITPVGGAAAGLTLGTGINGATVGTANDQVGYTLTHTAGSTAPLILSITGLQITPDDASYGDDVEVTVSGAGITKQTLKVGTYVDYGITLTAEKKDLPVLVAGYFNDGSNGGEEVETLEVTFQETVTNSWITDRKTTFEFPSKVKIKEVNFKTVSGMTTGITTGTYTVPNAATNATSFGAGNVVTVNGNKMTFQNMVVGDTSKAKFVMEFILSVDPSFTGDIELKVSGTAVGSELTCVPATVVAPVAVEAVANEVSIDYRKVPVTDIYVKENFAGALGSGKIFALYTEYMNFEEGIKYEVTEGDLKVDKVEGGVAAGLGANGVIAITVKSSSSKAASTIKLSNLKLYLDRTLPAGDYALRLVPAAAAPADDAIFRNYADPATKTTFSTDYVTAVEDYIKVVTAGRDQDDSTFTTQLVVVIGESTMKAGNKEIALDVPAYISNGYTMLPVRAVTEALSEAAIVRWDAATKTVTISFGARIITMTVGSKNMTINGTPVAMSAALEIKNDRAFLPLRDLGYALGLGDDKIGWVDETKTATLN